MHPDILPLHAAIEQRHWWFVARRKIIRDLLVTVEPPATSTSILDLGCGTGGNLGALSELYECIGVELDSAAVDYAREAHPGCEFHCGSIYSPSSWALEQPVNACLLLDVLEHLDDDREAVQNALRVLRPGGHLVVTVPAWPSLWSKHDRTHQHRRRYTPSTLNRLFEDAPVQQRLLSGFNVRLYPAVRSWRWIQNRIPALAPRGTTGDLSLPSPIVNRTLSSLFVGERKRLVAAIDRPDKAYARGVSLLAVYRKRE